VRVKTTAFATKKTFFFSHEHENKLGLIYNLAKAKAKYERVMSKIFGLYNLHTSE